MHETDSDATTVCDCCGVALDGGGTTNRAGTDDRWLDDDVLNAALPDDVRTTLGRLLGTAPIDTLGAWTAEIRERTDTDAVGVEDLCVAAEPTPHRGELDGETHHFLCFYDAVVLSALLDEPVAIRTESPTGREIRARAVGTDELQVTPDDAVFSFGVDEQIDSPEDEPSHEAIYAAICPYVRAFPDRDAYETWTDSVPAATVVMPLAGATELAAALVE